MIDVPCYSQRDARWRNKYVGFSRLKFESYGCTVTALSSFISHIYNDKVTPDKVNDKLKENRAFVGPLVYWYRVSYAYPKLKWVRRYYNYSNPHVAYYVYLKHVPVLVEVNAAKIGAARHWVLFLGSQKMMDPWVGKIESTAKYPPTGYALYNVE